KVSGEGTVFLEIDGHCKEYTLAAGETIIVDTGYLAAMTESCSMDIQTVKGAKNIFFGGEGLFHTRITGPGKVYLQSMPLYQTAQALIPYLPHSSSDGDGGIKINFGND
ncbi:MAG: AIM24 family protein, partial [Clostridia bacterium]|nr:AIM24 family protein [Clostridia bacterium]